MKPTARSRNSITDGMVLIRPPEPGLNRDEGGERWEWCDAGHAAGPRLVVGGAAYAAGRARSSGQQDSDDQGGYDEPPPAPPPPAPTEGGSDTDEIERLAALHANGTLTDEEFAAAKAKILGI